MLKNYILKNNAIIIFEILLAYILDFCNILDENDSHSQLERGMYF